MKYYILCLLLIAALSAAHAESVKAMTFNVRYPNGDTGEDAWDARKEAVIATVDKYQPDFVGMQEVVEEYLPYLEEQLLDTYSYFGRFRFTDGRKWDEACFLWYIKSRWEVVEDDSGTFQLSYTPEIPGSGDWDVEGQDSGWGNDARIVTWGRFREIATNHTIYVYNTHWDNQGPDDRPAILSAQRIVERKVKDDPVIYMGDLNARQGDDGVEYLLGRMELSDPIMGDGPAIAMVDTDPGLIKIDHVFILPDSAEIIEAGRKSDRWDVTGYTDIRASDHWPTLADVRFWPDGSVAINIDRMAARNNAPGLRAVFQNGNIILLVSPAYGPVDGRTEYTVDGRKLNRIIPLHE